MAQIDLSNYNLGELKGLQFDVEKELKERQKQDLRKAREQVLAIVQEAGMSVDQLLADRGQGKGRGKRKKPEA
ncbi:hypothetical protein QPK31_20725 [Massilia sp. YIM B02769]|jgi:DNA-binding protein H-NS|uniref:hypothetical protein n=1 Tax=unclassified Massilia TaxID=2609279 RepID=UPI0025B654BF|nr:MULTISPECIES: hypothetical protein [unclassified Massilia]MDN4060641.1 hypothetical protein [Massilia sp. YIM B02769]